MEKGCCGLRLMENGKCFCPIANVSRGKDGFWKIVLFHPCVPPHKLLIPQSMFMGSEITDIPASALDVRWERVSFKTIKDPIEVDP